MEWVSAQCLHACVIHITRSKAQDRALANRRFMNEAILLECPSEWIEIATDSFGAPEKAKGLHRFLTGINNAALQIHPVPVGHLHPFLQQVNHGARIEIHSDENDPGVPFQQSAEGTVEGVVRDVEPFGDVFGL